MIEELNFAIICIGEINAKERHRIAIMDTEKVA